MGEAQPIRTSVSDVLGDDSMIEDVFPGNSEMARRMRALDWSKTPLGPVGNWPQSLRTSVSTCLDCAFPIVLWWGPELAILYNDEYAQIMGPAKHPAALGQPGAKVWAEIWDIISPMLAQVVEHAVPTRSRDLLLHIERGYLEEAYFSFSYSPIHAEGGKVGGIFCPVIETTEKVLGERRLRTLRDLAARCKGAGSEESVYEAAAAVLQGNPHDVPFALLYRIEERGTVASLKAVAGIPRATSASPERVRLDEDMPDLWAMQRVARAGETTIVDDLDSVAETLPTGVWKVPVRSAIVMPMLLPGQEQARGILVAAVSPTRALDEDYRTFFGLVATQIASGLADAQALEEERRRAKALTELDRAKTAFFSNVSHEFRTPLTLMIGPLQDLLATDDSTVPKETVATLAVVHRNSLRLLKLVNTLLDFSRIEAGRIDASFEPTDLALFTIELASVFRSAIEKAGLRLTVDCPTLPAPVYVDRDMWEKIVLNLLSNALKFTLEGEISVALRSHGDTVELRVSDTGVGIGAAELPRMFQRFHRVRHTRARTHEGTGIGLALVHELARLHGGSVSVASVEGHGTTFTLSVPSGMAHLPPERIAAGRQLTPTSIGANSFVEEALRWLPTGDTASQRDDRTVLEIPEIGVGQVRSVRARVLVADDNADMRDYVARILAQSYDVDAVADGSLALRRIQANPPDLVLTDVMMPELDGFALLAAIRANERSRSIPVILLSARAGEEARIEGLDSGADEYLVKPFSARELLARVASQLQLARVRRDTEQALRYRSEQHQTLLNQAPLGVYLVDADFRIGEMNPVAVPVFGDIPGGVVGRDFDEIIRVLWEKDYADELVRIFRSTLATGEPYVAAERAQFRIDRGLTEYYEWRLDRITLPDGRFGLVCYFRDISEQVTARMKIAESERRLREADRRKDEFLALLAHELRNPLAPVRTGLELIRLAGDTPEAVKRVRSMMERQVGQMVRLIDDLLDVSRITSGKIVLQRRPAALTELVQSTIDGQRDVIHAAKIELTVDVPETPCVINVDATRFVQVLSNVLHNAAKFTPPGGRIRLTAEVGAGGAAGPSELRVTVSDTGVGISQEMLPHIFELFTQAESPTERSHGGLGIGLALARRLIDMHGGQISATSDGPGRGSSFVITLPLTVAVAELPSAPPANVARIDQRVVVIDDNADAATTLSMLVEELGGSTRTANDAVSGLLAVREFQPDVVFLDVGMPGMNGYEACRRIRHSASEQPLLIVAVTGWGQNEDKKRALDAGFDCHLTKPVDPAALTELLVRWQRSGNRRDTLPLEAHR
jgi:PAS domain S-box-containing protein